MKYAQVLIIFMNQFSKTDNQNKIKVNTNKTF